MKKAIIIGAGITGLRAAEELANSGYKVTVIERSPKIGGMTASFKYKDMILDYGPHKFYTQLPGIYDDFKRIVGENNYYIVPKKNSIRLLGKYFDFPVKLTQLATNIPINKTFSIGVDLMKEQIFRRQVRSYADYFRKGFGVTGYNMIFKGFAEKVWGNPESLAVELGVRRSPAKNIFEVIKTALIKPNKDVSADVFYYPKLGYGIICENLAKNIQKKKGQILLSTQIKKILVKNKKVNGVEIELDGKKKILDCDVLISTSSITENVNLLYPKAPEYIKTELEKLKFRSLVIAYIVLDKDKALKDNWIFFPEKEFCFNRVAEQKSFSPDTVPSGKTVLTAEITCDFGDSTYNAPEQEIKDRVIKDLVKAGLIKPSEVIDFFTRKAGRVYPVYSKNYKFHLDNVLDYLDSINNFYTLGRLGLFNYNNADHCLDMAKVTADLIINESGNREWKKARNYFNSYRIVD